MAAELAEPTVRLGLLLAAGEAAVGAPVATLMEVAMGTMILTKFKALAAALVVGCAVAVTATGWRANAAGPGDQPPPVEAPKRAARNPDKERIAELERERELLLKQLAELRDRLARAESALERTAEKEAAAKRAETADRGAGPTRPRPDPTGSETEPEIGDGKKQSEWIVLLHGEDVVQAARRRCWHWPNPARRPPLDLASRSHRQGFGQRPPVGGPWPRPGWGRRPRPRPPNWRPP